MMSIKETHEAIHPFFWQQNWLPKMMSS